jgi:hypothetical protein
MGATAAATSTVASLPIFLSPRPLFLPSPSHLLHRVMCCSCVASTPLSLKRAVLTPSCLHCLSCPTPLVPTTATCRLGYDGVDEGVKAMTQSSLASRSIEALVKVENLDSWTVSNLKQACRDAHVTVGGTKAVLLDRLRAMQQYCAPYCRDGGTGIYSYSAGTGIYSYSELCA